MANQTRIDGYGNGRNPYLYSDPGASLVSVTPSDSAVLSPPSRGLYIGGEGDVAVIAVDDTVAVTFKAVPAGTVLPVQAKKVMSTNTTATLIVALL